MEVEEEAERRYVLRLQPLDEIEGSLWPTKHVNVMNIIDMDLPHTHTQNEDAILLGHVISARGSHN